MLTWHHVLSPRIGMWLGLAETNRRRLFVCFFLFFVFPMDIFEVESPALMRQCQGKGSFFDSGKTFLPDCLNGGYLGISGLLWLQKGFSFWPFLYSGDSFCCSPVEKSSVPACTGSEWHLVLPVLGPAHWDRPQGLLGSTMVQLELRCDQLEQNIHIVKRRGKSCPEMLSLLQHLLLWCEGAGCLRVSRLCPILIVAFLHLLAKTHQQRHSLCDAIESLSLTRNLNTDHGCFK